MDRIVKIKRWVIDFASKGKTALLALR